MKIRSKSAPTVKTSILLSIAFRNLTADGRPDPDSLHAGLPVARGEKWLATLWLRQRSCRAF